MKEYPDEFIDWDIDEESPSDEFEDFINGDKVRYISQNEISDSNKLFHKVKELADKDNLQIYTMVESDGGTYWSKGLRVVNSLNSYALIKKSGYRVDNS